MRKILYPLCLCLALLALTAGAETLALTDGTTVTGSVLKFDDSGLMLRTAGDAIVNVPWAKFSQEALKQLAATPKMKPFIEPFIEPDESQKPARPEIKINPVTRLERPAKPSLIGGLVTSPVGWFLLFVLYAANLFAAMEIARFRARPVGQVVGVSAVLPLIAPAVFLALPTQLETPPDQLSDEAVAAEVAAEQGQIQEEIQVAEVLPNEPVKKVAPQIFSRGKFTFNKRFIETKFADYLGVPKGMAGHFTMELKTAAEALTVERIAQVNATDALFETVEKGQTTIPFTDILEIKLHPKNT